MKEAPAIEINAALRILRQKDAVSGSIFTGTDKVRSGYGNGDCLYFDFQRRVFAVADGTERFPWASRDILCRLAEELTQSGVPGTADGWKSFINRRVYPQQKYQHKTTFSCVAVSGTGSEISLTVAHGGDSVVMVVDSTNGDILFQTGRNMVFAGRSREIVDVINYSGQNSNIRVVIYSDGFEDFSRYCIKQSLFSRLPDAFITLPVDRICEWMCRMLGENAGLLEHDDIALIVLDPCRLCGISADRVLIGGTQPHEEKHFRTGSETGAPDRWIPHQEWATAGAEFLQSGITVIPTRSGE